MVTLTDLSLHGLLLSLQLLSLLFHGLSTRSKFSFSFFRFFQLVLVNFSLDLFLFLKLKLAEALLIMSDLRLALSDSLEHFLIVLPFLLGLKSFAFGNSFPNHFFLTLSLLIDRFFPFELFLL